jgi:hypothetical protein
MRKNNHCILYTFMHKMSMNYAYNIYYIKKTLTDSRYLEVKWGFLDIFR